jgi:hypothetical protein
MTRRRIIYVTIVVVAIVAVAAGLWWHGHGSRKPKAQGEQTVGDHTISLNQEPAENTGGLSVSGGGASDLGQLSSPQDSDGSGGSSGSGDSGTYDFTKYDKYKSKKHALFGDITEGSGAKLTQGKKATVYYRGWLTNGALVDQSPKSNDGKLQPFTFTMGSHEVIPGWEEGLYGMKAGGVRLVVVPPAAGYGSEGKGAVPPNAVLVFEIQLAKVQ